MNAVEFKTQIERLQRTYGPDRYPQERVDQIWEVFKRASHEDFRDTVSKLIGDCATAPMLPKFREAMAEVLERKQALQKRQNTESAESSYERITHDPSSFPSFEDYVANLIENESHSEDFKRAVNWYGIQKLEQAYERYRAKKAGAA